MQGWCVNKCSFRPESWIHASPNLTVSSTPTTILRRKGVAVSLRPARRPAGMREAPERPFSCHTCDKRFAQPQGVSRHRKVTHDNPPSCLRCDFKWTRPCLYRIHLKKCHPDIDLDKVLGKPAGSRRKSTIIGRDLPEKLSPPAPEPDRRCQAEPQQRPMTSPLPAVANVTHVSLVMLSVAYDPQPEREEPEILTRKHEDARGLESLGTTDCPSASSSTEERDQSANDVGISIQPGQLWLAYPFW